MAFRTVLDSNVLLPMSLCDTLLRLAELELYDPVWSQRILDEVERNLISKRGLTAEQAARHVGAMEQAFEDASVSTEIVDQLESAMQNEEKDRHVLAAAVGGNAGAIITNNAKDFPAEACDPHGVEIDTADEFLCHLFDLAPDEVCASVQAQADALKNPPHTLDEVLGYLDDGGAHEFVNRVRTHLASR